MYEHPYIYLSSEVADRTDAERAAIEQAVAEEATKLSGVSVAVSSRSLLAGEVPDSPVMQSVLNSFNAGRSGDVFVIFEPQWFINEFDGLTVAATHGSPWRYDTHVPIVFAGPGIAARHVDRRVLTVDVAPTLAALLGIDRPSGATGAILVEVLGTEPH